MNDPFLAHSEITNEIYIIYGKKKYCVTEQVISAMKATGRLNERPQGEWINPSLNQEIKFKDLFYDCSICKHTNISKSNFCPKCGAKMTKEDKHD